MNSGHETSDRKSLFKRLSRRINLTIKGVAIVVFVGIIVWLVSDNIQSREVRSFFHAQLMEKLGKQAMEDRIRLNTYIKTFPQTAKLLVQQKVFSDYATDQTWLAEDSAGIKFFSRPPKWFPRLSSRSALVKPRYALLLDSRGKTREVYMGRTDTVPAPLLNPSSIMIAKSRGQSYMTTISNAIYLVTSASVKDSRRKVKATLMLASPIDGKFLVSALGSITKGRVMALLTSGENTQILISTNPQEIPDGTLLEDLKDRYLITGRAFSDYGSSSIAIRPASLISMLEVEALTDEVLSKQRQRLAISSTVFILSFMIIIFWITRRIRIVTGHVSEFSQRVLGFKQKEQQKGDQLYILEERFTLLTDEVLESREIIQKQAKKHTDLIVHNAFDAIITIGSDGVIKTWNPQAETIFGWSKEETVGRELITIIIPPEYRDAHSKGVDHFMATGEGPILNKQIQITGLHRDGHTFPMEIAVSSADAEKGFLFIAIIRDITERKHAEMALTKAKTEAETANISKSEFLANMSHEIRTPMNGIVGMSELLLDTDLTSEQKEYLDMVILSSNNLLGLINDILDFSKIEAGKLDIERIDFTLRDHVGDTLKSIAMNAHEKGLELAYDIAEDLPDALIGDPTRLRQIVINLIGNAIKFTDKGEIVMRVDAESRTDDEVTLHFAVSDTGIGIPKEKQDLIFQSFSQADGSTTRQFGGTGLGLTISSQLVNIMKGKIWVESEPGKGSTFHFSVPLGLQKDKKGVPIAHKRVDLQKLPVLIVDDNKVNRRILQGQFKNWRMVPTVVDGGSEALTAIESAQKHGKPFALMITDLNMPEMSGFTFIEQANESFQGKMPPTIMLTSSGQRGEGERCRKLGIAAYLTKPVKQSDLLDAVQTVLRKKAKDAKKAPSLVTRHSLRENRPHFDILLAEDNAVNKKLAVRILEKEGHKVTVAGNGIVTVEQYENHPFDLILMDIQMPEMNGYEATAIIREKEKESGKHMPIIAMTAHVMKGDREKCLEAGMDGYVSKPINAEALFSEMNTLAYGHLEEESVDEPDGPGMEEPHENLVDRAAAMEVVDGDMELFQEMVELFLDDCPKLLANIQNAIAEQNSELVEREAHGIKGALRAFAAGQAAETAFKLEQIGSSGELSKAEEAYEELEREIERLKPELIDISK